MFDPPSAYDILLMARNALARLLTDNPVLKGDRDYHFRFISGYVSAMDAAQRGEEALPPENTTYEGYRNGYRTALIDLGIG